MKKKKVVNNMTSLELITKLRHAVRTSETISSHIRLEEFSSLVSHEMANVVNNLNFHIYKLDSDKKVPLTSADIEKVSEKLKSVVARFSEMIQELRTVSRRSEEEAVVFNVRRLIEDALELNLTSLDQAEAPNVHISLQSEFYLNGIYSRYFGFIFLVFKNIFAHARPSKPLQVSIEEKSDDEEIFIIIKYGVEIDWSGLDNEVSITDFSKENPSETYLMKKLMRSLILSLSPNNRSIKIKIKRKHLVSSKAA